MGCQGLLLGPHYPCIHVLYVYMKKLFKLLFLFSFIFFLFNLYLSIFYNAKKVCVLDYVFKHFRCLVHYMCSINK